MTVPGAVSPEYLALQQAVMGRYSLERELGRGGMGIVFLARDVALDRPIAIKLLPPALAERPGLKERFLREAQTAAKLSQPNIVPIHAVEERDGLVFFVMSYIEGETLGERLRTRGPLTPHETARLVREVAWALGYAHARGVVHRDIKPDNIMIERGTARAVVMDFGIAALAADRTPGEVLGTAQYISPEQANGAPVDGRADLYSLGVVAFLCLTGRLPFEADTSQSMIAMHLTRTPPPVGSLAPGLPRRLAQAVDRLLAKAPADRFPDGEALADTVAQTIEPERQLPIAVRMWLLKGEENRSAGFLLWFGMSGPWLSGLAAWALGSAFFGATSLTTPLLFVALGFYLTVPVVGHGAWRISRLRKLLAEGYTVDDARLALRQYVERRREELSYEYGAEPPAWAKAIRAVMFGAGAAVFGEFGLLLLGRASEQLAIVMLTSGAVWLGSAFLQTLKPGKRITRDKIAEWRLKFWDGKFAKWFEKIARFGLKPRKTPAELTYRPTEMAIGLAADALFAALPREQKRELAELPRLIERLQQDAHLMRRTVDELNEALSGLGEESAAARSSALAGDAAIAATRDKLRADLVVKRDEAAQRLGAAVSALEGIRLNLLRLTAGTGTVAELTADLTAARALERELDVQVAAHREVAALLKSTRRGHVTGATPVTT